MQVEGSGSPRKPPAPAGLKANRAASGSPAVNVSEHSESSAAGGAGVAHSRWESVWAARWIVLAAAILAALLAFAVSHVIPKRFSSSTIIRVTVPASTGISEQSVQAANALASQYAQVATAGPIVAEAAATLGANGGGLTTDVSAATVNAQNLVQISARAASASVAQARANAMATAFVTFLNKENAKAQSGSSGASSRQLRKVQARIQSAQLQIESDVARRESGKTLSASQRAHLASLQNEVGYLQGLEQSLLSSQLGEITPTLSVFSPATAGSQTQPRPTLYAIVAFLVVLLAAAQIAAFVGTRRKAPMGARDASAG